MWRWDQAEPFGNNPADADPDANSVAFDLPLRLPGQYFDKESGLHYNMARNYWPDGARYVEADPLGTATTWPAVPTIGLNHSYAYALSNPLTIFDPDGLAPTGGNSNPAASCDYYTQVCQKSGGNCRYQCFTAPVICRTPRILPTVWGLSDTQLACIRDCLIEEDKKAQTIPAALTECPSCVKDYIINAYHFKCYDKCGVSGWRFPGVWPLGNQWGPN